jgi:hypothetical protein
VIPGLVGAAALALLAWRLGRLDRGALHGLTALEDELRQVHRAARRQVFIEAAAGASATLALVAAAGLVYPGVNPGRVVAFREWAAGPVGGGTGFAPARATAGAAAALLLLVTWTYLVPLAAGRHHWLATLRLLHRPRNYDQQPCEFQTCRALAYCTNRDAVAHGLRGQLAAPSRLADLWYGHFLLAVNRHHQELVSDRDRQNRRVRTIVKARERCAESRRPLLDPARVRAAFGGRWPAALAAAAAFVAAGTAAAVAAGLTAPPA